MCVQCVLTMLSDYDHSYIFNIAPVIKENIPKLCVMMVPTSICVLVCNWIELGEVSCQWRLGSDLGYSHPLLCWKVSK